MDLMGRYNPNAQLYVQAHPPLDALVLTISFIARSMPCLVDPLEQPTIDGIDDETMMMQVMAERGASKHHLPLGKSFALDSPTEEECQLYLPRDCLKAIFLNIKTFKQFYVNASKHGYALEEYARLVSHVCYKNKEYSRKIAKHIIKGTNRSNAEELGPYLELMKQFLGVQDEYATLRMEWVFGVADFVVRSSGY